MGEGSAETSALRAELAALLRHHRAPLLDEWKREIAGAGVAGGLNGGAVAAHLAPLYDAYVEAVASGTGEALDAAVRRLREADHSREVDHVNGHGDIVEPLLLLHHVVTPALLAGAHRDVQALDARSLVEAPELSASRLIVAVVVNLIRERGRAIREEQAAMGGLSTPLLPLREGLLVMPLVGTLDPRRARQLTEHLLHGVRTHRAQVVVIDLTGVPRLEAMATSQLVQAVDAAHLLGTTVILSGISADVAQQIVHQRVDLGRVLTAGDLQAAVEQAQHRVGAGRVAASS